MTRRPRFKHLDKLGNISYYGHDKVQLPLFAVDAQGQVSLAEVFQKAYNRKDSMRYPKLDRVNIRRNTHKQQLQRTKLILAMEAWHNLTDHEKQHWTNEAAELPVMGHNLFVSEFIKNLDPATVTAIANYGFGHNSFGHAVFGSPAIPGITSSFLASTWTDKCNRSPGYGQAAYGRRHYGNPYWAKSNYGYGIQRYGISSYGQSPLAPFQYGYGWQWYGASPYGSNLPGWYGGA